MRVLPEVMNLDCMEVLGAIPYKFFDLAIVDPPYGIGDFTRSTSRGKKVERKYKKANWNEDIPEISYFYELERVSKNQIIWGANYYNSFKIKNKNHGGAIVWNKGNNHPDMSTCEIASNTTKRTVDYFEFFWAGFTEKNRIHPCQKPVELYKWLLHNYAKAGDKILDTHLGSGSSRIAAHDMGFDFWGYEIDKDYFEAQEKRFKQHIAQLTLSL